MFPCCVVQDIKRDIRTVLDLGSGAGHLTQLLCQPDMDRSITMLDLSGGTWSSSDPNII